MAGRIFLSYRREDSGGQAGRLSDRLVPEFGRDNLFLDIDSIPLGVNFVKRLTAEVAACDILIAVIGARWLELRNENGERRVNQPNDFVRVEIAAALQRDIPVIPALVDGASIPRQELLPDNLKDLALRNGIELRHSSFHDDVDRLIRELRKTISPVRKDFAPEAAAGRSRSDIIFEKEATWFELLADSIQSLIDKIQIVATLEDEGHQSSAVLGQFWSNVQHAHVALGEVAGKSPLYATDGERLQINKIVKEVDGIAYTTEAFEPSKLSPKNKKEAIEQIYYLSEFLEEELKMLLAKRRRYLHQEDPKTRPPRGRKRN